MSRPAQGRCETTDAVARLTAVLTSLGDALARPDLDGVLAQQPPLHDLARTLPTLASAPADRESLRAALTAARIALRRVRQLGDGLEYFSAASRTARGLVETYDRGGRTPDPARAGSFDVRG